MPTAEQAADDTPEASYGTVSNNSIVNKKQIVNSIRTETGVTGNTILDKNQASTSLIPVSAIKSRSRVCELFE